MAFSFFFRSIVLGLVAFVCGVMGVQGQVSNRPNIELKIERIDESKPPMNKKMNFPFDPYWSAHWCKLKKTCAEEKSAGDTICKSIKKLKRCSYVLKAHDDLTLNISNIPLSNYAITVNNSVLNFALDVPEPLKPFSPPEQKYVEKSVKKDRDYYCQKQNCLLLNLYKDEFNSIKDRFKNKNPIDDNSLLYFRGILKGFEYVYFNKQDMFSRLVETCLKDSCYECTKINDCRAFAIDLIQKYYAARNHLDAYLEKMELGAIYSYTFNNIPPGDMLKIDFSIIPKDDTSRRKLVNNSQTTVGSYEIPIKGGLKIDFSAGLAGTSLINQSFYVKDSVPTNADLKRGKIKEKPKFPFDLGPAAFMHFYCRSGRLCNLGGNFGIMTNTEGDLRYLLGGSLMFGIKTRFCLNTGVTVGKVKELRDDYRQALGNDYTNVSSKDDLYINRFKVGFYFGFSVSAFQSKSVSLTPEKK